MSAPQDTWLIVSFDIEQDSSLPLWLPIVSPMQTSPIRPGGIYQWIGPQASRILLYPGDSFRVVVLSLYQPLQPIMSDSVASPYLLRVKECRLQFSNLLLAGSPFSYCDRSQELRDWDNLEGAAGKVMQDYLQRLAEMTQVSAPLNDVWHISNDPLIVVDRERPTRWELSMILTVEITIGDGPVQNRTFKFDPECQVGTGTGSRTQP